MAVNDTFGDRMKRYEAVAEQTLMRRAPVIIRVDGKAFHSLTRSMQRPFDPSFVRCMANTAAYLVEQIQGARLAFAQSDEISVVLCDYDTLQTDAWLGYRVQKLASISASLATVEFTLQFREYFPGRVFTRPVFDARAFSLPDETEVVNYLIWRQRDATRNSILMTAQERLSPSQMHGKNTDALQEILFTEFGVNWNNTQTHLKRGLCAVREDRLDVVEDARSAVTIDWEIPVFTQDRGYILSKLPGKPAEVPPGVVS